MERLSASFFASSRELDVLRLRTIHPGEVLREHYLEPFQISQTELARAMGVPKQSVNEIVRGKRAITAELAIGISAVLGTEERFWLGLQADHDLELARYSAREPGVRKEAEGAKST